MGAGTRQTGGGRRQEAGAEITGYYSDKSIYLAKY